MQKLYSLIYVVFCCTILQAQKQDYLFTQITPKEGLASITPNFIQQDARGYMWIGGNSVLQRYDGHRFQNFYIGKGREIPGGTLMGIQFDNKNRLWLLTGNNNLGYLDADRLTYHAVTVVTPPGFENTFAALQVNKRGEVILIYVGKGITTFNEAANEVSAKYNPFAIPKGWEPYHVWQDEEANYWIGSANGLLKYNSKKKIQSYKGHNIEKDPVISYFENRQRPRFIYSFKKVLWISFDKDIYSYDINTSVVKDWTQQISKALGGKNHYIHGVLQFTDGSTWLAGEGILAEVNFQKQTVSHILPEAAGAYSIRYDAVWAMYQDSEKSNWVCTNKGLFRFNPAAHVFNTIKNTAVNDSRPYTHGVTDLLETTDGELLVSTWGAGVFSYDKEMNPVSSKTIKRSGHTEGGMAWSLLQTKKGDIWIGYQNGMIGIYNAATKKMNWQYPEALNGSTTRQLVEDKNGNVWLGTQGGSLVKWDAITNTFHLVKQLRRLISKLYIDTQDNIWAGTDNDGVYCLSTETGEVLHYYSETGEKGKTLLINGAADIIQYNDSTMVIAGGGLNILNTSTQLFTYLDEGIQISSLVLDKKKNLWFTMNTFVVCRQSLTNEEMVHGFNEQDGIANFSFQTAAAVLLRNGKIVFGTNHDMLVFDPERALSIPATQPEILVSGIFLGDRRLPVDSVMNTGKLKLRYNQNSLIFQFTNNQFQTLQMKYYMVDGLDKDWKLLPMDGELKLTYLAPGKYVIKTTSFNEKQQPGKITTIEIDISAPFYKQWWFYSGFALLVTGLLLWVYNIRIKRKEAMQSIRSSIASKLHEEVNVTLNNINVLSEMAKLKADSEPQKSKDFIEQINSKSQNMIDTMDDMLWSIAPENDSMQKTIERMQEYIDAQINGYAVKIELIVDERVKQLNLPMQLRHEAFLLFKSSLKGLLLAGTENIGIQVAKEKNYLLYLIKCDTVNSDTTQLSNLLQNRQLAQKMETIKAKWDVQVYKSHALMECRIPLQPA